MPMPFKREEEGNERGMGNKKKGEQAIRSHAKLSPKEGKT